MVMKCLTPLERVCNGQGPEECKTVAQSSCTTRYVENSPGQFVADTKCEKIPQEICGQGCVVEEAPEECHEKQLNILVDVPEEVCDLTPQQTCQLVTRLVPRLRPVKECTVVPQEVCMLRFSKPRIVEKPLRTEWCQDGENESSEETEDDNSMERNEANSGKIPQDLFPPAVAPPFSYSADSVSPASSYTALRTASLVNTLKRLRRMGIMI